MVFSGLSPDHELVEFIELPARRAPVLRCDAGTSGVPLASAPRSPAVRRARRGGSGPAAGRAPRRGSRARTFADDYATAEPVSAHT